nr:unnamed protein product [Callosobruchus analis]
MILLIFQKTVA